MGTIALGAAGVVALGAAAAAGGGGGGGGGSSNEISGDFEDQEGLTGGAGEVRVNLVWHDTNDLDLHCVDPCGNEINFMNKSASCNGSTGRLDVDANAVSTTTSPVENIVWDNPSRGDYECYVDYWDGIGSSNFTVRYFYGNNSSSINGSISGGSRSFSFTY